MESVGLALHCVANVFVVTTLVFWCVMPCGEHFLEKKAINKLTLGFSYLTELVLIIAAVILTISVHDFNWSNFDTNYALFVWAAVMVFTCALFCAISVYTCVNINDMPCPGCKDEEADLRPDEKRGLLSSSSGQLETISQKEKETTNEKTEKQSVEKRAQNSVAKPWSVKEEKAAPEKPASEKPISDKPLSEKPASGKPASDKKPSENAETEKAGSGNQATEKSSSEKRASEKPASEKTASKDEPDKTVENDPVEQESENIKEAKLQKSTPATDRQNAGNEASVPAQKTEDQIGNEVKQ